jgi:hypothetical protein
MDTHYSTTSGALSGEYCCLCALKRVSTAAMYTSRYRRTSSSEGFAICGSSTGGPTTVTTLHFRGTCTQRGQRSPHTNGSSRPRGNPGAPHNVFQEGKRNSENSLELALDSVHGRAVHRQLVERVILAKGECRHKPSACKRDTASPNARNGWRRTHKLEAANPFAEQDGQSPASGGAQVCLHPALRTGLLWPRQGPTTGTCPHLTTCERSTCHTPQRRATGQSSMMLQFTLTVMRHTPPLPATDRDREARKTRRTQPASVSQRLEAAPSGS